MRLKLCILGDSHTGALKRAWDRLVEPDLKNKFDITFFASRGEGLSGLRLHEKFLIPTSKKLKSNLEFTSNGLSFIDIEKYDLFLIYGLGLNFYFPSNFFYSNDVINQSIEDNYKCSLGYHILMMIREVTNKKAYLGHNPMPAQKEDDNTTLLPINSQYTSGISIVNKKTLMELNSELIHQPLTTLTNGHRNTHLKFTKNSIPLGMGDMLDGQAHPVQDNLHMNDDFGKIWLESFLNILA